MDYETETILRREILVSGKSRAFINDSPVNLNQLSVIGSKIIDIHSQHENLLLNDEFFQLNFFHFHYHRRFPHWRHELARGNGTRNGCVRRLGL